MMTSEECIVILISSLLLWDLGGYLIPFYLEDHVGNDF